MLFIDVFDKSYCIGKKIEYLKNIFSINMIININL